MLLLAISLLTILAGTLLLARFRKENQGRFFICISWFFIIVGFLLFLGFIAGGICKIKNDGFPPCRKDCRKELKLNKYTPGFNSGPCCPAGMHKGLCRPGRYCMPHDSTLKCCPKHTLTCDSGKMVSPK